jgi:uncharacterized SAM-binding protein YcdF (DUF218 family)
VTLGLILLLVAAAIGLSRLNWRNTSRVVAIAAAALFLGVGCGPITAFLLTDLQSGYSAAATVREAGATAIILLGNGTERVAVTRGQTPASIAAPAPAPAESAVEVAPLAYGRLVKAVELYRACRLKNSHCTIVVTGGDPQHHGASEAAVYSARLQQLGVESTDILTEGRSLNTWQNAQYTAAVLSAHPVDQVFLVTSGIHLRRSLLYFGHFGIRGQPVRADFVSAMLSPAPLSYNFLLADLAIHEYVGVLRYSVYQFMGWNVAAERIGLATRRLYDDPS